MVLGFAPKYHICDAFGIPITADITSIGLLLLLVFDLGLDLGVPCALLLAISIVLHELAHSLTARAFGCRIAEIRLSLLGGCASGELPRAAFKEFLVAAAGPAMSLALGFGMLMLFAGTSFSTRWLRDVVTYAIIMNIMLGCFNLLPGFPMDGGRIFRSALRFFLPRTRATYVAMIVGRVAAIALVVLPALGVTHLWIIPIGGSLVFRLLIAWMIWNEGAREYRLSLVEGDFRHWTQADFDARVSPPPYDR